MQGFFKKLVALATMKTRMPYFGPRTISLPAVEGWTVPEDREPPTPIPSQEEYGIPNPPGWDVVERW